MTDKLVLVTEEHRRIVKKYLKLCRKEQVVPLPILNRLELGDSLRVLSLEDYTVNEGQAKCLGECLGRFGPGAFTKLYLYNNGLKDKALAAIFLGAARNQHISSLEVAMNQVQAKATSALCSFFGAGKKQLRVLRLSATKTGSEETELLFQALSGYKYLTDLKLSNFKISGPSAQYLAKALCGNFGLKSLDLSWNEIAAKAYEELMDGLMQSKTLSYVTLANSPILQRQRATTVTLTGTEGLASIDDKEYREHSKKLGLKDGEIVPLQVSAVVAALYQFIRRNRSLLDLDLSFMSLRRDELLWIGQACRKSRTLLSFHLTGNVCVREGRRALRRILRPRKRLKDLAESVD